VDFGTLSQDVIFEPNKLFKEVTHQLIQRCFKREPPKQSKDLEQKFPWFGLAIDKHSIFGVVLEYNSDLKSQIEREMNEFKKR
jgi:hypothetical protein